MSRVTGQEAVLTIVTALLAIIILNTMIGKHGATTWKDAQHVQQGPTLMRQIQPLPANHAHGAKTLGRLVGTLPVVEVLQREYVDMTAAEI